MRFILPALLALLAAGCAAPPASQRAPLDPRRPVATTAAFELHSNPWINLHHLLHRMALWDADRPQEVPTTAAILESVGCADLQRALPAYAELTHRDLLFDPLMGALKQALTEAGSPLDPGVELPEPVGEALRAALPDYLALWWEEHDGANRAWIEGVLPLLRRHEAQLVAELERAYGGAFPAEPIRVDVSAYANWAGAYTSNHPDHITLSSFDPENGGPGALEVLLHEASHSFELESSLQRDLDTAFGTSGGRPPRDLWHMIFFFTAGELTARVLARDGIHDYVPYGERVGIYTERGPARVKLIQALDDHWRPFLRGEITRAEALTRLAQDL